MSESSKSNHLLLNVTQELNTSTQVKRNTAQAWSPYLIIPAFWRQRQGSRFKVGLSYINWLSLRKKKNRRDSENLYYSGHIVHMKADTLTKVTNHPSSFRLANSSPVSATRHKSIPRLSWHNTVMKTSQLTKLNWDVSYSWEIVGHTRTKMNGPGNHYINLGSNNELNLLRGTRMCSCIMT